MDFSDGRGIDFTSWHNHLIASVNSPDIAELSPESAVLTVLTGLVGT